MSNIILFLLPVASFVLCFCIGYAARATYHRVRRRLDKRERISFLRRDWEARRNNRKRINQIEDPRTKSSWGRGYYTEMVDEEHQIASEYLNLLGWGRATREEIKEFYELSDELDQCLKW